MKLKINITKTIHGIHLYNQQNVLFLCNQRQSIVCRWHIFHWALENKILAEINKHVDDCNYSSSNTLISQIIDVNYNILSTFHELVVDTIEKASTHNLVEK